MKYVILCLILGCIYGCGGSSGSNEDPSSSSDVVVDNNDSSSETWQSGVFEPSSVFKDRCEAVRTNLDIDGNAYPDVQGTILTEQMWLRSWTNETYLWYDEVFDFNPVSFSSAQSYFEVLVTEETTESGAQKDNFHFYQSTAEYEALTQAGTQTGYGIDWAFIASAPPRNIVVTTVDPNSAADLAGVIRGDKLIRVDSVDVIEGSDVDFLNAAIFPSEEVTHDFIFERLDGSEITVTMTSGTYETSFVNNTTIFDTSLGKVGYVRFDAFRQTGQEPLIDAFQSFVDDNVTELILDLRYNGGGLLAMASQLAYMVAGDSQTDNRTFSLTQYNDKTSSSSPTPFYSREIDWDALVFTSNVLPTLNLTRVFVITTGDSCSASESVINGLRGIDVEVVQIGETTCGKPFGFLPTDNCGTTYFTIQFQGVNEKGFGDFVEGFSPVNSPVFQDELPGCVVADDLASQLGDATEGMLSTALYRLTEGQCPEGTAPSELSKTVSDIKRLNRGGELNVFDPRYQSFLQENQFLTPLSAPVDDDINSTENQ